MDTSGDSHRKGKEFMSKASDLVYVTHVHRNKGSPFQTGRNASICSKPSEIKWKHLSWLFSCSVMSDSLQPHGLKHARLPCPSPSPEVCPSSCSLHQWCHPAIASSDTLFSFCPQLFPAAGTFPMSWLFASDDQDTGASASTKLIPM